ncbi:MAG: hypothetical protein ABI304_07260 [Rudaea sp.]
MNEMRLEPPTDVPPGSSPPSPPNSDDVVIPGPGKGSIVLGFVLGWVIVVGGQFLMITLRTSTAFLLPEAVLLAVAIYFAVTGKTRTAAGIFIAFGTMIALALLLVAACFGMMSNGGFMH